MTPDPNAFDAAFQQAFASFGTIGAYGNFVVPTSPDDILNQTVGQYLDLIDTAEAALTSIDRSIFNTLLNDPNISAGFDPETRAVFEAWAAGDFSLVTGAFTEVRAAMSGYSRDTLLREAINGLDPNGGTVDQIETTFLEAEARIAELLWGEQDGVFASPQFSLDPSTGSWFANVIGQTGYGGGTLGEFYGLLGEAAGNAIMSFIGSRDSVLGQLINEGADSAAIAAASGVAEAASGQAIQALQNLGTLVTTQSNNDPSAVEAQATSQAQALVSAIIGVLPGLGGALDSLIIGSRNSDPSFVVSPEGGVSGSEHGDWFYLSKLADVFDGGVGQDVLFGFEGNDELFGGADNDNLFGGLGRDMLRGDAGDDTVHGGDGDDDIAMFNGSMGQYTVKLAADGSVIVEDRGGSDGTDVVTDVETLSFQGGASIFGDGNLDLSIVEGIAGLDSAGIDSFIELYIAYFNRAPDAVGLYFWGSAFANGTPLEEIAGLFLDQAETRETYPEGSTTLDFVTQVYSNVLGRVPDTDGLSFWEGQLESGSIARGTFILEVLRGAKSEAPAGTSQSDVELRLGDRAFLSDKTDIGSYFSVIKGLSDVSSASNAMSLYERGAIDTIQTAVSAIDVDYAAASAADSGALLLQLVGVVDDPFAV